MALQGDTIHDLPPVAVPATELPGAELEVDLLGGPSGGRVSKRLGIEQLAPFLAGYTATNAIIGGEKLVIYLTQAEAIRAGRPTNASLDQINPLTVVAGNLARVDLSAAGNGLLLTAVYDNGAGPYPFGPGFLGILSGDGQRNPTQFPTTSGLAPLKWVLQNSPEALAANVPDYSATYNQYGIPAGYRVGDLAKYQFPGKTVTLRALVAGQLPAPSDPAGDANWYPIVAPAAEFALSQNILVGELRQLQASARLKPHRLYTIFGRTDASNAPLADIRIAALSETELTPTGYEMDAPGVLVRYNLATDTATAIPPAAGTFALLAGQPGDNTALAAALAAKASKQDIANLIGVAPAALDTLAEIDAQLQADEAGTAAILATQQQHTQQLALLAPDASQSHTLVVHGFGQTIAGRRGSLTQPFASLAAAHDAAQDGDTVIVLPGAQPYAGFIASKNLTWQGVGRPAVAGQLVVGAYLSQVPIAQMWVGFLFNDQVAACKPLTGLNLLVLRDCDFGPAGNFLAQGLGTNNAEIDLLLLQNCRFAATGTMVPIKFGQRFTEQQAQNIILDNCLVAGGQDLANGPINPASRLILRGPTRLQPGAGHTVQVCFTVNSPTVLADSAVIQDERTAGVDRRELLTIQNYRTNTLVLEGTHQLSQPSAGPNVASIAAQVITTTGGTAAAYSAPRTGTIAQVLAAINADLTAAATPAGVLVYVRFITTPATTTDETHFLFTVSA